MFLADYHAHTHFSPDAGRETNYKNMAAAAAKAGLKELCITEHCECNGFWYAEGNNLGVTYRPSEAKAEWREAQEVQSKENLKQFATQSAVQPKENLKQFATQSAVQPQVVLPWGVEMGQMHQAPAVAERILGEGEPYDFVIGSVHNLLGQMDFALVKYQSVSQCHAILDQYFKELEQQLDEFPYNIMGHVDYPLRYMKRLFPVEFFPAHEKQLRHLLAKVAAKGRGIEINTKPMRVNPPVDTEQKMLLRLWKEEGGTLLTLGSDAHYPEDVGANLADARRLAEEAGFTGTYTFRGHKATYHSFEE